MKKSHIIVLILIAIISNSCNSRPEGQINLKTCEISVSEGYSIRSLEVGDFVLTSIKDVSKVNICNPDTTIFMKRSNINFTFKERSSYLIWLLLYDKSKNEAYYNIFIPEYKSDSLTIVKGHVPKM